MNTNSKLRVALFFGGVSSEHDVSCVSASAWLRALGQEPAADKYEVFPVGITKDGRWLACRPTPEAMADAAGSRRLHALRAQPGPEGPRHLAAEGRQGGAGPH